MKIWKWLALVAGGIATALLVRRPKTYLDAMPELQKAVKKAEEEKKVALSKKTDEEITSDSTVNHQSTIERGKADIDSASARARANITRRVRSNSSRRSSNSSRGSQGSSGKGGNGSSS